MPRASPPSTPPVPFCLRPPRSSAAPDWPTTAAQPRRTPDMRSPHTPKPPAGTAGPAGPDAEGGLPAGAGKTLVLGLCGLLGHEELRGYFYSWPGWGERHWFTVGMGMVK